MRPKAELAIDSEAMRARGIVFSVKSNQLVKNIEINETTLLSKTRFSRHCFGFQSRRFSLPVGYNIQPSSSSTSQNAAFIIGHQLDFTKMVLALCSKKEKKEKKLKKGRKERMGIVHHLKHLSVQETVVKLSKFQAEEKNDELSSTSSCCLTDRLTKPQQTSAWPNCFS